MTKLRLSPLHFVPLLLSQGIYNKITSRNENKIKDIDRLGEHSMTKLRLSPPHFMPLLLSQGNL